MEYISDFERATGINQEPLGLARNEVDQAEQMGRDVAAIRVRLADVDTTDDAALTAIYENTLALPAPIDWPYFEESGREAIAATLPEASPAAEVSDLENRISGAWTGRVIGNMMGKPFEIGPTRDSIRGYLQSIGSYPLLGYVPFAEGADRGQLGMWGFEGVTEGRIDGSVRDDDVDYTIFGLHLLETYGAGYTTYDVAAEWLTRFPAYQLYTAERATYQNLIREVPLDEVGEFHNPYREWIGALIRADIFGYVAPGDPRRASEMAYADAFLSHRANGIYGEMWAAALIATAFTASTPLESVVESLRHVPPTSRLAVEVQAVVADHAAGVDWETAMDNIVARQGSQGWVHTINNSGALAAALLWGEGDFASTTGLAIIAGLDTDSIGATAGSWAGAFVGLSGIPTELVEPLHDHCRSAVFGFGDSSITELARRTVALAR